MKPIATTKMSSKGQVVIPEGIRQQLGLGSGTQFVVVGQKDVIILKTIAAPEMKEFDGLIKFQHRWEQIDVTARDGKE